MSTIHISGSDYQQILLEIGKAKQRGDDAVAQISALQAEVARLTALNDIAVASMKFSKETGDALTGEVARLTAERDRALQEDGASTRLCREMSGHLATASATPDRPSQGQRGSGEAGMSQFIDKPWKTPAEDYWWLRSQIHALELETAKLRNREIDLERENAALRAFANDIIAVDDPDRSDIQDAGVKHGLLENVTATEPCGESCACAELGFPAECYRKTKALDAGIKEREES